LSARRVFFAFFLLFSICFSASGLSANELAKIALGSMEEYSRLVFTFQDRLDDVILRRDDADSFIIDFGPANPGSVTDAPTDSLVRTVEIGQSGDRLTARVTLNTNKFEVRNFLSRDRFSCIVDFKNLETIPGADLSSAMDGRPQLTHEERLKLALPTFQEVVKGLSLFMVSSSSPGPPELLVQSALTDLTNGDIDSGLQKLERFKEEYPNHPYADPAYFLIGEAYYRKGLPDNFVRASDAWRLAIEAFPDSYAAPLASFMLGEINSEMGFRDEAAAFYALAAENYPDSNITELAILKAADMKLALGLNDEARNVVEPLLSLGLSSVFGRLALAREAMADYQDTLYSQACEKFRQVLDLDPEIYQLYPDMLYALGDSYSYLNRPDLTILFLEHALNLIPEHPKADVMLARIGNAYQSKGLHDEAISFFNIAKDRYPERDGGLVSQIRLADMGALRAFFSPEQVFDSLERGARQATVKMYENIIAQSSESPLLQLAYLKIGQAQAADGENGQAINWLRDMVTKYPNAVLMEEAKPILSRAVVNEAQQRFDLGQYNQVEQLDADNEAFLEGPDLLRFKRLLAQSFENEGKNDQALAVWKFIEEQSPEKRLADQKALIEAALKSGQPMEAFNQLKKTFQEFPDQVDYVHEQLGLTEKVLANISADGNIEDILAFRNDPMVLTLTPVSQAALSDAIYILVDKKKYDQASALMDLYREHYPDDDLSPEYLLTQSKMDRRQKRVEKSWNRLSDFRVLYPDDERVPGTILETAADARKLDRLPDAYRYEELFRQLYPDDIRSRNMILHRAAEQAGLGDVQAAVDALRYFQTEYPGDPAVPATYIDMYQKLAAAARPDEASRALDELRALHPSDPLTKETYFIQYRDLIKAGRANEAVSVMARFDELYPNDDQASNAFVVQYRDLMGVGEPDLAFSVLDRFRNRFPNDPRQPDLLLEEARDLFALGRNQEGLNNWNDFLQQYPEDSRTPELTLLTARRNVKEGLIPDGLERYHQYIANYPGRSDRPQVLLETASIETDLSLNPQAYNDLATFRREYPGSPEEPQVLLDQVNLAKVMGRIDDVGALYDIFRANYPTHPQFAESYLDQTRAEMAAGRTGQALNTLERGIVSSQGLDDSKQVQDLILNLYLDEGRIEDWAGAMEEFLGRVPNGQGDLTDRFAKYIQVAQVYQELGRQQDAQRNFDLALANRPPDPSGESLYTIAGAYKRMGLQDQYRNVLEIIAALPDPLWQNVATQELNNLG
jgi:TolA-binding protein